MLSRHVDVAWRSVVLTVNRAFATAIRKSWREGKGSNVLGDPRIALTQLMNELCGIGVTLGADQVVTTCTCVVPSPAIDLRQQDVQSSCG